MRPAIVVLAAVLVAGACTSSTGGTAGSSTAPPSSTAPQSPSGPSSEPSSAPSAAPTVRAAVLASDLAVPWGVAFLPGGDALVSERDSHRIVRVSPSGTVTPLGTVPGVADDAGEGGLLGIALSPAFARDRLVYAYLTGGTDNRVVRFTLDGSTLGRPAAVFTGIPKAAIHNGGRIAFGPDGLLYVTAGDAGQRERARDASFLGGKVLRMTADGAPAPGNPDPGSVVWTRGHRNPQGIAFGPGGAVYEAEFGQNSLDEVNLLRGGRDYGWPDVEGTEGSARGVTAPLLTFRTDDASPSGLAYADGALWLATLQGERVYRMALGADGRPGAPMGLVRGEFGRLRTVAVAPDGSLWVTTSNRDGRGAPTAADDRIVRLTLR